VLVKTELNVCRQSRFLGRVDIVDDDDFRPACAGLQGILENRPELSVTDKQTRFGVIDDVGDGVRIEAGIDRIQHGAGHWNSKMAFKHFRGIEGEHRNRVVFADATGCQAGRDASAAIAYLGPAISALIVNQRFPLRINICRTLQKR